MIEENTLFDTVIVKEKRSRTPEAKLKSALRTACNRFGMYHYKIIFNRVWFNKIKSMPKGIDKIKWIELAREVAEDIYGSSIVLIDKKKANQ